MLIEDEIALEEMKDLEQPSLLSKQGDGLGVRGRGAVDKLRADGEGLSNK